jgi:hypothetical protein
VGAALLLVGGLAQAHGPAPAPLDVLSGEATSPGLVRASVGLASRLPDGAYEYVCPSRWDGNERALAAASEDGRRVLVHSAGVAYRSLDGGCTFEAVTSDALYVTAAVRWGGGFLLSAEGYPEDDDSDRSQLWAVDEAGTRALPLDVGVIDALLSVEGGALLAGARPAPFVARLGDDGTLAPLASWPSPSEWRRLSPRAASSEGTWLVARDADVARVILVRADGSVEDGPAHDVIHGPVRVGARWVALFDGVLHQRMEGTWMAVGEVPWTCLGVVGGAPYACSLEGLFALRDDPAVPTPVAEPSFSLRQLGPPRDCGDADQNAACVRDWAHFGGESGWLDSAPARTPSAPRGPLTKGGCAIGTGSVGLAPWALLLAVVVARRRLA